MMKVRKLTDGVYSFGNETIEIKINGVTAIITAITNFSLFDLKRGESIKINSKQMESYLNEELFSFKKL